MREYWINVYHRENNDPKYPVVYGHTWMHKKDCEAHSILSTQTLLYRLHIKLKDQNPLKITAEKGNTACNPQFATFEHLLPKMAGGKTHKDNLVLAHAKCNNKRHKMKWPHDPFYSIRANRMAHYEKQFSKQKKQLETENELGIDRTTVGITDNELA
jgi:hypothetical protein